MIQVNIHEAKTQPSRIIDGACQGEEVAIAKSGTPVVRLTPMTPPSRARQFGALPRRAGLMPGGHRDPFDRMLIAQAQIDQFIQPPTREAITGVVLAGGQGRRMGGRDKGLVPFRGRPLVQWVLSALRPQVATLIISANRNREVYEAFGYPVIADRVAGFQGPLAGFASAMAEMRTPWMVVVPCDGPFLAPDLVERLRAALRREGAEIAAVTDGMRMQPVYALIPVTLAPSLNAFLAAGERRIDLWYGRHRVALADFSDRPGSFTNINSEGDAAALRDERAV
jgi:molybdenum cofactor guanylyltransferase